MNPTENPKKRIIIDAGNRSRIALSAWLVMLHELVEYRELIHRLVMRNIAGQFRQSFLGYLWIILPPVATTVIFTLLRKANIINVPMPEGSMPYALFALVGTTLWGLFTQITVSATTSVSNAGSLVSKIYFPREVLVLSAVGNAIIYFAIRVVVISISFMLFMYAPHWQVVFFPLILLPLVAFAIGIGLICAPINTMMHDMGQILTFCFQFGMFLAPTIYPTPDIATATSKWQVGLYWLHTINPVSHFIHAIDTLIETGAFFMDIGYIFSSIIGALTLMIGWRFFHICEPLLAERL